jgi:hypothetical protein
VSVDGGWREQENNEKRKNEEEEFSCSWNHSLFHFSSSLSSSLDLVTIGNSTSGGISIEGGIVNIMKGEFYSNYGGTKMYPSFRHNILCSSGTLNISSLSGGDGNQQNSSLFIRTSDNCILEGIVKNHPSPLFIPFISSIEPPIEENSNTITFNGIHLFPCSLSLSLSSFSSDETTELGNLSSLLPSFISDSSFTYSLSLSDLSELKDYSLLYSSLHFSSSSSSRMIIANRRSSNEDGGNLSKGGISNGDSSSSSNIPLLVMTLLFVFTLLILIVLIIFFSRKKNKRGDNEESKGREMNLTEKEYEKEEQKNESLSIKKSPSSELLLSPHVESEAKTKEVRKSESSSPNPEKQEKKEKEQKIEVPSSTSISMNYLLEGFSTLPPFMKSIVDIRDSLSYQMKTSIPLMSSSDLEQLSSTVGFWVATLACHLINSHQGMEAVSHLSPSHLCFCPDGTIIITSIDLDGIEGRGGEDEEEEGGRGGEDEEEGGGGGGEEEEEEEGMSSEWRRYSSPEMLKGEIREGNEKSVVFVLGMIINSILNKEIPFKDSDCISAADFIVSGKRPSISSIEKEHLKWISVISNCLKENITERLSINEFKGEMEKLTPKKITLKEKRVEKNQEQKEVKEQKPTVAKSK